MLSIFLSHQWKSFWRSRNKAGSIATQVLLGFFILYFLTIAVVIGFGMETFIQKIFPGKNTLEVFNGFILYYFLLEFAMRIQLQELPTLSITPYLHLKISKQKIVSFLNIKALFSFFNFLPLFIFLPFCTTHMATEHGPWVATMFVVSILSLTLFNNYLVLYIKRKAINNIAFFAGGIALIAAFGLLDYYKIISIATGSNFVFEKVIAHPFFALLFTASAFAVFKLNSLYLLQNLYTEELNSKEEKKASTEYAFLNRFGKVGELAALELKLILRHKRPRGSVLMGFMFLLYGLLFYKSEYIEHNEFGKMLFAAIFMTGITILTYGQFMFAWQSAHFDGLISNKIDLKNFIKAKLLLFTISSTIITILASFYVFISWKLLLLHLAAYLFNIGFGSVMVLYVATFNYKRLDITKSASFNWQGTGATQFILGIPFILIPMLLYMPFSFLNLPYWGLLFVGGVGLIMILIRDFWINFLTKCLQQKKYKIAEGFRE